jgi:choline dehydrogenase-like flavoprotein
LGNDAFAVDAGSVVAGRLALAGYRVLLLEAGGPTQSEVLRGREAVLGNFTLFDIPLDWQRTTATSLAPASLLG